MELWRQPKPFNCYVCINTLRQEHVYIWLWILFLLQSLIDMHIYDNALYANLEDLNAWNRHSAKETQI